MAKSRFVRLQKAYHEEKSKQPTLAEQIAAELNKKLADVSKYKKAERKRFEKAERRREKADRARAEVAYREELEAAISYAESQSIKSCTLSPTSSTTTNSSFGPATPPDSPTRARKNVTILESSVTSTIIVPRDDQYIYESPVQGNAFYNYGQSTHNSYKMSKEAAEEALESGNKRMASSFSAPSQSPTELPHLTNRKKRSTILAIFKPSSSEPRRVQGGSNQASIQTKKTKRKSRLKLIFKKKNEPRV